MRLTILGSGTSVPVAHRGPTGFWVQTERSSILVDCGSGVIQKLVRAGGDVLRLDAVLLTHAHLDHLSDLLFLLFSLRNHRVKRTARLEIVHSRALTPYLDGLRATFGSWLEPEPPITYRPVDPGARWRVGDVTIGAFAVDHHETSLGFVVTDEAGRRLCIPGDTGFSQSLIDAASDADALVVECSTTDDLPLDGHLCPADLLVLLGEARPKSAILTHLFPHAEDEDVVSQVRALAPCPVWEASDGATWKVAKGGVLAAIDPAKLARESSTDSYLVGTQSLSSAGASNEEEAVIRAMMEAHLAEMDNDALKRGKYDVVPQPAPSPKQKPLKARARRWTAADLSGIKLTRRQSELVKRAASMSDVSIVKLRGLSRDKAMVQLRAALQTWRAAGEELGRVVTGKGKHSEEEPVIKLEVLNWLDSEDGLRWILEWAPELTRDGQFGSVVVSIKR